MGLWESFKRAVKPIKQEKQKSPSSADTSGLNANVIPLRRIKPPPRPARKEMRRGFTISKKKERQEAGRVRHRNQFIKVLKRIQGERKGGYIPDKFALDNLTDIEMGKETSRIGCALNRIVRKRRMREIQKESRRRNRNK